MALDSRDSGPAGGDGAASSPAEPGRRAALRARSEGLTVRAQAAFDRAEQARPAHASVETCFRWFLRDRQIAGGVLGGGLAYRLFFWALAVALLICGGLGFAGSANEDVEGAVHDSGLSSAVADTVATAAQQSESGRWWLLAIGLWTFLWFSWSLLRAVRLVHAAAWQTELPKIGNAPRALLVMILVPVLMFGLSWVSGWVRANVGILPGLLATLLVGVGYAGIWLFVSAGLPSGERLPWHAYVPGAIVFGVGLEALHVFTVYYLATKLANASELYGSLGLAGTALFFLYLIGRGLVWSAELNAVVWDVRGERTVGPMAGPSAAELLSDPDARHVRSLTVDRPPAEHDA
jgi:uncharacterized BrkB/YihY/UPF0761 family membrane protein